MTDTAYVVALTGGIAAGKSATAECFAKLGSTVFDADVIAREVVARGQPALEQIAAHFGRNVLTTAGELDRARMRARVFADAAARRQLEAIVHPHVRSSLLRSAHSCSASYCVLAVPLLIEAIEDYRWVDRVLVVDVPADVQLARLTARPGIDLPLARNILAAQTTRTVRLAYADDVIDTAAPISWLHAAVARLDRLYRERAMRPCGRSATRPER